MERYAATTENSSSELMQPSEEFDADGKKIQNNYY